MGKPADEAFAAVIAASGAVASYRRGPMPGALPPGLHVPTPSDIPRLLAGIRASKDARDKVTRITAAALFYALEKKAGGYAEKLLNPEERTIVANLEHKGHQVRTAALGTPNAGSFDDTDRSCLYCRVFQGVLFGDKPLAIVVNHEAHVIPSFDPETNISAARVDNFQLLVRKEHALQMINLAHPLRWRQAAPELFQRSDPAFRKPDGSWNIVPRSLSATTEWSERIRRDNVGYIYEEATRPLNEDIVSEIRNLIKITDFSDRTTSSGARALDFDYSLEACLESKLGLGWEHGGLDVDAGEYHGRACPSSEMCDKDVVTVTGRDLAHWDADWTHALYEREPREPQQPEKLDALRKLAANLGREWGEEPWLTTVSASKRLRYTAPGDTPVELWAALTWMAPAVLFAFINRAVCQTAHLASLGVRGDRRTWGAARVPFQAAVQLEVDGASEPPLNAQSVNISETGMQVRTAFLPAKVHRVTCRFATLFGRNRVTNSGDVVWSKKDGGDESLGIQFTDVDPDYIEALKRMPAAIGRANGVNGHPQNT